MHFSCHYWKVSFVSFQNLTKNWKHHFPKGTVSLDFFSIFHGPHNTCKKVWKVGFLESESSHLLRKQYFVLSCAFSCSIDLIATVSLAPLKIYDFPELTQTNSKYFLSIQFFKILAALRFQPFQPQDLISNSPYFP